MKIDKWERMEKEKLAITWKQGKTLGYLRIVEMLFCMVRTCICGVGVIRAFCTCIMGPDNEKSYLSCQEI